MQYKQVLKMEFYNIKGFSNYLLGKGEGENDWSVWSNYNGELIELKCIMCKEHIQYSLQSDDGCKVTKRLHRLIAEMFVPIPKELKESVEPLDVHHIDHNPQNNAISNLIWIAKGEHSRLHNLGKHHSEETKNKMSEGHKGKHHSDETKRKISKQVFQYTLDGKLIAVWSSTQECGRNGYKQSHVAACCRGELNKHKGFKWSYEAPL